MRLHSWQSLWRRVSQAPSTVRSVSRIFLRALTAVGLAGLIIVFQNCGGMEAAYNPLYDSDDTSGCVGVTCYSDLSQASLTTTGSGVILDQPTTTPSANVCDSATCFDVGGYCDNGGFAGTRLYYQWLLNGQAPGAETATSVVCDENGRWRLFLHVPDTFVWTSSVKHSLRVYMHVIDSADGEMLNPNGVSEIRFVVSGRP